MRPRQTAAGVLCASLLTLVGCSLSPLARPTAAFSGATSQVVDNSENAYRAAVRLNDEAQASMLVARFDSAPMDPHSLKHLMEPQDLEARTEVLDGLRTYAQTIADLSSGVSSSKLDDAATSVGTNLQKLGAAGAPFKIKISPQEANAASTALKALGEFLTSQKVKRSVPKIIQDMDPNIDAICNLLLSDISILRNQASLDYDQLLTQQDSFIRHAKDLSAIERRAEIHRLPKILARKQATDDMLTDLADCVKQLALTHHALAAAATSKEAPSLAVRINDLQAIGSRLAHYYGSLPTE